MPFPVPVDEFPQAAWLCCDTHVLLLGQRSHRMILRGQWDDGPFAQLCLTDVLLQLRCRSCPLAPPCPPESRLASSDSRSNLALVCVEIITCHLLSSSFVDGGTCATPPI